MFPKAFLRTLIFALPLLVVAFAVIMGGYALAVGMGDEPGGRVLWYLAMAVLMLLVGDMILLVGILGLEFLADADSPNEDDEDA